MSMLDQTACGVCGCTDDGCRCCLKHLGMPMMARKPEGVVIGRDTELDFAFIMDAMLGTARAVLLQCLGEDYGPDASEAADAAASVIVQSVIADPDLEQDGMGDAIRLMVVVGTAVHLGHELARDRANGR